MRRSERDVAVTGVGAVSTFGAGADALVRAVLRGEDGIRPLRHPRAGELKVAIAAQLPEDVDVAAGVGERLLPLADRTSQFALAAAAEAVAEAGLDVRALGCADRAGVVLGTGVGGAGTQDEQYHQLYGKGSPRVHPLTIVRLMANAAASLVSMSHGLRGPAFVVSSACASSNHAIGQAVQLIRSGVADVVLAGGTEACLHYGPLRAWEAMRVLASDTCRPFSASRRGLVLGEGAAVFVLESRAHALARGARVKGYIAGVGMSADALDIVAPQVDGASRAMQLALADAGLDPAEVDYVNAHGTGTPVNDPVESRAIRRAFGPHADRLAVSSTKSMHGHALGAAGALELVAVLGAIAHGIVPPTIHFDRPDPECDLDFVPNVPRERAVRVALSNSFAFGGLNAVLAVTAP